MARVYTITLTATVILVSIFQYRQKLFQYALRPHDYVTASLNSGLKSHATVSFTTLRSYSLEFGKQRGGGRVHAVVRFHHR